MRIVGVHPVGNHLMTLETLSSGDQSIEKPQLTICQVSDRKLGEVNRLAPTGFAKQLTHQAPHLRARMCLPSSFMTVCHCFGFIAAR